MGRITSTFTNWFRTLSAFVCLILTSANCFANYHPNIIRAGQGLIFADANSFINPGENSLNHGLSLETVTEYRKTPTGTNYLFGPSANLATWGFNIGGFYQRTGAMPTDKDNSENFGATFGTRFLYRRLTTGIVYSRNKSTASGETIGNLYGTMTAHFGKIHPYQGWLLSGSVNQQVGIRFATTAYTVGVGYGKNRFAGYEFNASLHDIYNPSDWSLAGYWTDRTKSHYWSTGISYSNIRSVKFLARGGWMYGHFDTSLYCNFPVSSADTMQLGISIRQVF